MKILGEVYRGIFSETHGYFDAKKYFKGDLVNEIFITWHDKKEKLSSYGYVFICEQNIVITVKHFKKPGHKAILELEKTDKLEVIPDGTNSIKDILNASISTERSMQVKTTRPINFIEVNSEYFILAGIQMDLLSGKQVYNLSTLYVIEENYNDKIDNFIALKKAQDQNASFDPSLPLPGVKKGLAMFNIYAQVVGIILSFMVLFGVSIVTLYTPESRAIGYVVIVFTIYYISVLTRKQ